MTPLLNLPRISLDFSPNTGNEPVTKFTGSQTWTGAGGGFNLLQNAVTSQYNGLSQIPVNNEEGMFRRVDTGPSGAKFVPIKPGFRYEAWESLNNIAGSNPTTLPSKPPRAAAVVLGNETVWVAPWNSTAPNISNSGNSLDRTLGFSVRTVASNVNPEKEQFSANMNKTAVAGTFVYKRTSYFNSEGNKQPTQTTASTTFLGIGESIPPLTNTTNFAGDSSTIGSQYGYDYRSFISPQYSSPPASTGMPTTDQLQPLVILSFGNAVGRRTTIASAPYVPVNAGGGSSNDPQVNDSFEFPPGAYPGQKIELIIDNYAFNGTFTEGTTPVTFAAHWYGDIRINIPFKRVSSTLSGAAGLEMQSWYAQNNGSPTNATGILTNDGKRNYYQIRNQTDVADALANITKSIAISMIWDGGVQRTWTRNDFNMIPSSETGRLGYIQYGWRIIDAKFLGGDSSRILNP